MQQMDALRKRVNPGNEWFRIGLASATILAPMMKRWTDLRDADSTQALRAEAEARWKDARSRFALANRLAARRGPVGTVESASASADRRNNNVARIWLIGVGVGLVAAGAGAYFLVQRRMNAALDEPLVDLPVASSNGHSTKASTDRAATRSPAAADAGRAAIVGVNGATATATATASETSTPASQRDSEALRAAGAGVEQAEPAAGTEPVIRDPGELPGGATTVTDGGAPAGVVDADEAPYIGNIRTMVYHERDDDNLPAEENRIYFASEDEAHEAGYRRDREDVPAGSEAGSGSEAAQEAGGTGI